MAPGANRILQHTVVGAVVLACIVGAPRPSVPLAATVPTVGADAPAPVEPSGPTLATGRIAGRPAAVGPSVFSPAVDRWRPLALTAARRVRETEGVKLEPDLLLALVAVESSGDDRAVSAAGAVGLAQVQPATFKDMVVWHPELFPKRDPRDPAENLLAGGLYLVWCAQYLGATLDREEGWRTALNAYNYGPSALRASRMASGKGAGDLPRETATHEQRVLAQYGLASGSFQ